MLNKNVETVKQDLGIHFYLIKLFGYSFVPFFLVTSVASKCYFPSHKLFRSK